MKKNTKVTFAGFITALLWLTDVPINHMSHGGARRSQTNTDKGETQRKGRQTDRQTGIHVWNQYVVSLKVKLKSYLFHSAQPLQGEISSFNCVIAFSKTELNSPS